MNRSPRHGSGHAPILRRDQESRPLVGEDDQCQSQTRGHCPELVALAGYHQLQRAPAVPTRMCVALTMSLSPFPDRLLVALRRALLYVAHMLRVVWPRIGDGYSDSGMRWKDTT
jgi:hypothetical protein